jgi:hypothetical protein
MRQWALVQNSDPWFNIKNSLANMKTPGRVLLHPSSALLFLRPAFLLRLVRFRWRIVVVMLAISSGLTQWATLKPYSAVALIYAPRSLDYYPTDVDGIY